MLNITHLMILPCPSIFVRAEPGGRQYALHENQFDNRTIKIQQPMREIGESKWF